MIEVQEIARMTNPIPGQVLIRKPII